MGATLIAAAVVVLILGMVWLGRSEQPDRLAVPMVDGVTLPTDRDGRAVDVPPSQPATAVSFGVNGQILRPDPVRARIVDESGVEVLVTLPPNTTVDMVTGEIVPRPPGSTTRPGGTPSTTRPGGTSSTTDGSSSTTQPETTTTTAPTSTTESTTTTEPTTTTESTTTTETPTTTDPPAEPTVLGALLGSLIA